MKSHIKIKGLVYIGALFFIFFPAKSNAELRDRGNGLIYDDVLDVTWLADANYPATMQYTKDGKLMWYQAKDFVVLVNSGKLENFGFTDWRLPETVIPDPSCSFQSGTASFGTGCQLGDMAHLYNDEFKNSEQKELFKNMQDGFYWSGTNYGDKTSDDDGVTAWAYNLEKGLQGADYKGAKYPILLLRNGDAGNRTANKQ